MSPTASVANTPGRGDWTEDRLALHGWLGDRASVLASIYAGAVAIVHDDAVPGRDLFVWHAIREIRNVLPVVLNGGGRTKRWESTSHILSIARLWREEGHQTSASAGATEAAEPSATPAVDRIEISPELAQRIGTLVEEAEAVGIRLRESSQQALASVLGTGVPSYIADAWTKAFDIAPGFAHIPDKPHEVDLVGFAIEQFEAFESTLMTIIRKSFENMDELDDILQRANGS